VEPATFHAHLECRDANPLPGNYFHPSDLVLQRHSGVPS
jgi:hypothetical protein